MLFAVGSSGILAYIAGPRPNARHHTVLFRIELSRSIRSHSEVASLRHGGSLRDVQQLAGHASCLQRSGRSKAAATPSGAAHVAVLRGLRARSKTYWLAGKPKVEHLLIHFAVVGINNKRCVVRSLRQCHGRQCERGNDISQIAQSSTFKFGNERTEAMFRLQKELVDRCDQASRDWLTGSSRKRNCGAGLLPSSPRSARSRTPSKLYQECILQRVEMAKADARRLSDEYGTIMQKVNRSLTNSGSK
jgi:hypothetical protein